MVLAVRHDKLNDMEYIYDKNGHIASHMYYYSDEQLINALKPGDSYDPYEAMELIGKRKIKKALDVLKNIALYDEDKGLQEEAIRTIRTIGGRKALDILRYLKTTEHKTLIDEILEQGAD